MNYFTYILKCSDGTFYTGITNDLEKRLRQHNGEILGGAIYTRSKRPVVLKYFEKLKNRSDALKREYEIKQMRREEKERFCLPAASTASPSTTTRKST